jgi:hypothetical protein
MRVRYEFMGHRDDSVQQRLENFAVIQRRARNENIRTIQPSCAR